MSRRTYTALAAVAAIGAPAVALVAPATASPATTTSSTATTAAAATAATAAARADAVGPARQAGSARWARAVLRSTSGNAIGVAVFRAVPGGTQVRVEARYVKPGWHGLHIHGIGKCEKKSADPKDASKVGAFLSSGGHLATGTQKHPDHAGDLPQVLARADTRVSLATITDRFTVGELRDRDGSAVVLHSGPDNYANIPERYAPAPDAETAKAGDSGTRVACGVIH